MNKKEQRQEYQSLKNSHDNIDYDKLNDHAPFNDHIKRSKAKKRDSLFNVLQKNNLLDRCHFPNDGTVIVDSKYTYYCQKKMAKVKGNQKKYKMRGVQHFIDTFLK